MNSLAVDPDLPALTDVRGQIGFTEFPAGEREQYPPSPQKLVRTHPGSKRKTLYLSAHASHVVGWPVADGRLLLFDLNAHFAALRIHQAGNVNVSVVARKRIA